MTPDTWHLTPDTWHLIYETWLVTHGGGWTFSQNFSSLALSVCTGMWFEDLEEKDDWINESMNELINDEGVCRTAPATQGLLKTYTHPSHKFFQLVKWCIYIYDFMQFNLLYCIDFQGSPV